MRVRAWAEELRTRVTGVDPGLTRLELAGVATASMVLAAGVMSVVRLLTGQAVTVVLFAAVLAMISNLAVNEPDLGRRRVTTALMLLPAAGSIALGTLLASNRIVGDVVFVAVMILAVWIRRYGPRGFALGMAMFMPYFFTQFLQAKVAQLPWLMLAAAVGIGSTLLLRCWLLAEDPDKVLQRLLRAFRAHVHAVTTEVIDVLEAPADDRKAIDDALRDLHDRRVRLNDTALLLVDRLERRRDARDGDEDTRDDPETERLDVDVLDVELAAERLAVSTRRLADDPEREGPLDPEVRRRLVAGVRAIGAATATGTPPALRESLLAGARRSVAPLTAESSGEQRDRAQRVAFAVARLADALDAARVAADVEVQAGHRGAPAEEPEEAAKDQDDDTDDTGDRGLALSTRQAIQVGVATSLAIVFGELVSPARWYWAVVAAFVMFAGTASRGDVLTRGWQRLVGTVGGVVAGMLLAFLVGGHFVVTLVLLFVCVFLALYLLRISQGLMAFWITAVLALLYGLIGQFSVETLVLRVEETAVGGALGALAGFLVLPKKTRTAFVEAFDDTVDAIDDVLCAAADAITGRPPAAPPVELAREMDDRLGTLRQRAKPLDSPLPWRRGRGGYQSAVRVLTAVDHYARALARLSDRIVAPGWAVTLDPAMDRVRANIDGLRELLDGAEDPAEVRPAEQLVDAAEAWAARTDDPSLRPALLAVVRVLRRIDQIVVRLDRDLRGSRGEDELAVSPGGGSEAR
ncbi:MAG TPA: FUSC family protein [Pseudonocardia sp.]|nr:FUSC family protein [Pseudonocardia sp.]